MTRTEAIFDMIKGLPEIEITEILESIHEHCYKNDMGHIFEELYEFYDNSSADEKLIDENIDLLFDNQVLRDKLSVLEKIECTCPESDKHGETSIMQTFWIGCMPLTLPGKRKNKNIKTMRKKSDTFLKVFQIARPFTLRTVERFNDPVDRDLQAMMRDIKERFLIECSPSKRENLARIGINLINILMR